MSENLTIAERIRVLNVQSDRLKAEAEDRQRRCQRQETIAAQLLSDLHGELAILKGLTTPWGEVKLREDNPGLYRRRLILLVTGDTTRQLLLAEVQVDETEQPSWRCGDRVVASDQVAVLFVAAVEATFTGSDDPEPADPSDPYNAM